MSYVVELFTKRWPMNMGKDAKPMTSWERIYAAGDRKQAISRAMNIMKEDITIPVRVGYRNLWGDIDSSVYYLGLVEERKQIAEDQVLEPIYRLDDYNILSGDWQARTEISNVFIAKQSAKKTSNSGNATAVLDEVGLVTIFWNNKEVGLKEVEEAHRLAQVEKARREAFLWPQTYERWSMSLRTLKHSDLDAPDFRYINATIDGLRNDLIKISEGLSPELQAKLHNAAISLLEAEGHLK